MIAFIDKWGRSVEFDGETYATPEATVSGISEDQAHALFDAMPPSDSAPITVAVVPDIITNFQARAALMDMPGLQLATLFDDVDAMLKQRGGKALQAWEYANDVERLGPLVQQLAEALGWSSDQLDAFFVGASQISA